MKPTTENKVQQLAKNLVAFADKLDRQAAERGKTSEASKTRQNKG